MPTHVALLRGLNVGGHRVKMDDLRACFADMGFGDVWTFIASGNVVFTSDREDRPVLEREIEAHLESALGYAVATFLRSPDELSSVAAFEPPGHREGHALYVVFLKEPADGPMRERFAEVESPADRFAFEGREIYWSIDGKMSESSLFGSGLDKAIGKTPSTTRNTTSVRKLVARLG